ncbi:unnamed protein product [Coffea canephora]|uniref:Uncharacterized protein n=1 Tax=Coffea canephora TaxID=49390 RepID=A0A068TX78_COFCA|nr:unnamed protein product [Coffea canephora]
MRDDDFIGYESDLKLIMEWLQNENSGLSIYSAVGLGGSGKTTLVAKAYNSKIVKQHFNCHAWITVSQKYDTRRLLRNMIKEFYKAAAEPVPEDVNSLNYRELIEMLANYLCLTRYLLVLDDVSNIQLWTAINASLPNEGVGSRIMLTSQREDVALSTFGIKSHVCYLNGLARNDAWNLFCKKAFQQFPNGRCPQGLEVLARELAEKCRGLPLALVALVGVMFRLYPFTPMSESTYLHDYLNYSIKKLIAHMKLSTILRRVCTLSHSIYQKNKFLPLAKLFDYLCMLRLVDTLWFALGRSRGVTAETYLIRLVKRNMLHVVKRNAVGRLKRCQMHDLMRDIALSTSRIQKFCGIYDAQEASNDSGVRRLQLFHSKISPDSLPLLLRTSKFFRVLELQAAPIEKLPDELANLFNLRYLNIRTTKVNKLNNSIGSINLETLDLRDTKIEMLPNETTKLQNLRHLFTSCSEKLDVFQMAIEYNLNVGTRIPPKIWKLKNLQVLDRVRQNRS